MTSLEIEQLRCQNTARGHLLRAREKEIAALKQVIEDLVDVTNGCPLPKYQRDWNAAMKAASEALERTK